MVSQFLKPEIVQEIELVRLIRVKACCNYGIQAILIIVDG